jgi:hypothetical protein
VGSQLNPALFDFVHDFADDVSNDKVDRLTTVEESSPIIAFCETFFEQFLGDELGAAITGFDQDSKRIAAREAERLKQEDRAKEARQLLALFEKFCDLHADVVGGTYGAGSINYQRFHADYMRRLLGAAEAWATAENRPELTSAIASARQAYEGALGAKGW